jgi:hypothetical protein
VGHTLILAVNAHGGTAGSVFTATDTKGNTWTQRFINDTTVTNNRVAVLTAPVTTALTTSDTINLTISSGTRATWLVDVHDFDDLAAFDVTANAAGTASTSMDSGLTATSTQNSELLFGAFGWAGTQTLTTPGAGYTAGAALSAPTAGRNLAVEWQYVNTAGTRQATATLSGGTAWAGGVVAMKAAAVVTAVKPNSVVDNTAGFTNQGGAATLQAAVADASDATYVESPTAPANKAITFGVPTLAAGSASVTVRARLQPAAGPNTTCKVELLQGATVVAASTALAVSDQWADYVLTLNPSQNSAITDRSSLRVRLTANQP